MSKAAGSVPHPPKLLANIDSPADLKKLNAHELKELCGQIRSYLVESVSQTGGHLGPNLGVVELTVALHRCFKSPRDTIVFDTGHQAYVHKLLTGRKDFSTLRQTGGISGYPSRIESEHDVVENSHASTSLSWACGIAQGKALRGDDSYTIAVIGDGAMTGGMAWEALNNIAAQNIQRLIIVLNDNGRSYAPTIGGLANHLNLLRADPRYEQTLDTIKRMLLSSGKPGEAAFEALKSVKRGLKNLLVPQAMFEDLGIKYFGPIDGHDLDALTATFKQLREYSGPAVVHTLTSKGRGFVPAENDPNDRFHAVGVIHPETGLPVAPARFGWTSVFAEEMLNLARKNSKLIGVSAAMTAPVGLGPMAKELPDRVIDVGIAEAHAATMCAGLAYAGYHPVFAVYATFLNRAFDQVLMDAALHSAGITIVLDRAGATGDDGASHNGMWDLALLAHIPNLELTAPRDAQTLREALRRATQLEDRVTVIRYPKGSVPDALPAQIERGGRSYDVLFHEESAANSRVLFLSVGPFGHICREAAIELAERGIPVDVIDPLWVLPFKDDLLEKLKQYELIITLEDGLQEGGIGAQLAAELMQRHTGNDQLPLIRNLGIKRKFLAHTTRQKILQESGLTKENLVKLANAYHHRSERPAMQS